MIHGKVYLVGAGPGDPGLLTIKARNIISAADCIIYDHLVNPEVLKYATPYAEFIYAGRQNGQRAMAQENINALLVTKASEYQVVVRLKGGDPFVFGRGGEEAEALGDAGIDWELVPGVSAGIAGAAYAGIPLTHRHLSSSVTFITGCEDPNQLSPTINWEHLALGVDTLVFFVDTVHIGEVARQLIQHGRTRDVPVALIGWGAYEQREIHVGILAEAERLAAREQLQPPSIIVIGEVVKLRERLQWFASEWFAAVGD